MALFTFQVGQIYSIIGNLTLTIMEYHDHPSPKHVVIVHFLPENVTQTWVAHKAKYSLTATYIFTRNNEKQSLLAPTAHSLRIRCIYLDLDPVTGALYSVFFKTLTSAVKVSEYDCRCQNFEKK